MQEQLIAQVPTIPPEVVISPPNVGVNPGASLSLIIGQVFTLIFSVAILVVLFFIIYGAFQWITSGGEKEAVGKARDRIINALIGLAVLALAFLIANIAGSILSINVFNLQLPHLGER